MNESVPTGITNHLDLSYLVRRESPGIHATAGSLVHTASVIENHHHRKNRLFGQAAAPVAGVHHGDRVPSVGLTPYTIIAGGNTAGQWLPLLGTDDTTTGEFTTEKYFDIHLMFAWSVAYIGGYILELVYDDVSEANGLALGNYSEEAFKPQSAAGREDPIIVSVGRIPTGKKLWARGTAVGAVGDQNIEVFLGVHFYENGTP